MCQAARQLLSLLAAVPKWTNVWIVLEAGDGSATSPFYGQVINCASGGPEVTDNSNFCKDWWTFRGGKEGRRKEAMAAAAGTNGSDKKSAAEGADEDLTDELSDKLGKGGSSDGDPGSCDEKGDVTAEDAARYPPQEMLSRRVVKTLSGGATHTKCLSEGDLRKVLFLGGLEDINQVAYADIQEIFNRAGALLRARCGTRETFSWVRFCPMALLANAWSSPGFKKTVDGAGFLPPNNRQAKGQTVQQKRLMMVVAVHLSPFYAKIFEQHFAAARESGLKKRFRPKDPFDDAKKSGAKARKKRRTAGDGGKLTRAEQLAAAKKARVLAEEAKRAAEAEKSKASAAAAAAAKCTDVAGDAAAKKSADDAAARRANAAGAHAASKGADAAAGALAKSAAGKASGAGAASPGALGSGGGPMQPASYMPLCALERQSAQTRMHAVCLREPTALLPASTLLSVATLSGEALTEAARAILSVRVVLPRELLKKAFSAMSSAKDATPTPIAERDGTELAVQLNLGNYDPVFLFSTTLMQMSSVLAFNEAIESSRRLASWLGGFSGSTAALPAQLNFLSGEGTHLVSMAEAVRTDIGVRLLGDCVWAQPRVGRLSAGIQSTEGAFGGCSVGVRDVCDAGQRAFMTNALLDAGLAELHHRCAGASVATGVLSCTQSASFTSINGVEVDLPRAMLSITEVLSTWGPSVEQFVMLVNIDNSHWVSASVSLSARSVTLYDSLGGPSTLKSLIASRLLLFARQAELRRRVLMTGSVAEPIDWMLENEVNVPAQRDSYNCGLFAFAYIWCFVHGHDFASMRVIGDELRLSLMHFILRRGGARVVQGAGQ